LYASQQGIADVSKSILPQLMLAATFTRHKHFPESLPFKGDLRTEGRLLQDWVGLQ